MNERCTSVRGDPVQLATLTRFLRRFWSDAGLPADAAATFELVLEEAFLNIVMHGSPADRVAQVDARIALADGKLTLTIEDDGPAFDPLCLPAPDVTTGVEDRRVGGLGVFLVRQLMDSVRYQRLNARNQLQMSKRLDMNP